MGTLWPGHFAIVMLGIPTRGTSVTVIWNNRYNIWNALRFQLTNGPPEQQIDVVSLPEEEELGFLEGGQEPLGELFPFDRRDTDGGVSATLPPKIGMSALPASPVSAGTEPALTWKSNVTAIF